MRTEALRKRQKLIKGVALVAIVGGLALQADALQSMFRRAPMPPSANVALPSLPAASAALPSEPGKIEGLPARDLSGIDVGRLDTGAGQGSAADVTMASPALAEKFEAAPVAATEATPAEAASAAPVATPAVAASAQKAVALEASQPEFRIVAPSQPAERPNATDQANGGVDCVAGCRQAVAPLIELRAVPAAKPAVNAIACVAGCGRSAGKTP